MSAPRPILIHGSGGDRRVWAAMGARLQGAVTLDLPGRDSGEPSDDVRSIAATCGAALLAVEGPRVLVGHSLGGAVALETALMHPDRIDGLVIISSAAYLPVPEVTVDRAREDFAAECDRLIEGSFADPSAPMAAEARAALEAVGPERLATDYAACRSVDLRGRLGAVRVPVLVVVGSDDPFTPQRRSEELTRELPQAHMAVVAGARHMPMAEFDATSAGLIAAYLARLELTVQGA